MSEIWIFVDARHLGVAKDIVYRWSGGRAMPAHRLGRLWKLKLSEVAEWVRACGADAADEPDGARAPN